MDGITEQQLKHYRAALYEKRDELLAIVESENEASQTVELDQTRVGRLSRMDALLGQAMSIETKQRHQLALRNITQALSRIDSGDYGYCLRCDEPVAPARLDVDPAAALCINCASKEEII